LFQFSLVEPSRKKQKKKKDIMVITLETEDGPVLLPKVEEGLCTCGPEQVMERALRDDRGNRDKPLLLLNFIRERTPLTVSLPVIRSVSNYEPGDGEGEEGGFQMCMFTPGIINTRTFDFNVPQEIVKIFEVALRIHAGRADRPVEWDDVKVENIVHHHKCVRDTTFCFDVTIGDHEKIHLVGRVSLVTFPEMTIPGIVLGRSQSIPKLTIYRHSDVDDIKRSPGCIEVFDDQITRQDIVNHAVAWCKEQDTKK